MTIPRKTDAKDALPPDGDDQHETAQSHSPNEFLPLATAQLEFLPSSTCSLMTNKKSATQD